MCYIQITSVCNMSCAHCCMSCGKNYKGKHMSQEIYDLALAFTAENNYYMVIGGGEPTLHPHFRKFLMQAVVESQKADLELVPFIVTNGSKTIESLWLAEHSGEVWGECVEVLLQEYPQLTYSEQGYFDAVLSQDDYHDPIEPKVVEAFKRSSGEGIRNVSNNVIEVGHAHWGMSGICACSIPQIKPDGKIFLCGCDNSPQIGTVQEGLFEVWEEVDINYDFEGCINTPQTNLAESVIENFEEDYLTVNKWVDENIPIKKSMVNHPDTHRII